MTIQIARLIFVFGLGIVAGCARSPASPGPFPSPTSSVAPQAVLRISPGPDAPLGAAGYTPFVFDASASTGDGLTYRIDFGDGQSADTTITTHIVGTAGAKTARLTVTDRMGRTAVSEQTYFAAEIQNRSATFWFARLDDGRTVQLTLKRAGANLSGLLQIPSDDLRNVPISGRLTGDRDVVLRTFDGAIEMSGSLQWKDEADINFSEARVRLRMTLRGGPADGATALMLYADPY